MDADSKVEEETPVATSEQTTKKEEVTVEEFYDEESAASYAKMMDDEMAEYHGDLATVVSLLPATGLVLDVSCGSGHMLSYLATKVSASRPLHGIDLSPAMIPIASKQAPTAAIKQGTMVELKGVDDKSAAAVLNTFALHHVSASDAEKTLAEAGRVLQPNGVLYLAVWEGTGSIDMPKKVVANQWPRDTVVAWLSNAGLTVLSERQKEWQYGMNMLFVIAKR